MTTWNPEMTKEEATKLYKSEDGMMYPDTAHNRAIMKSLVHEQLTELQKNKSK